MIENVQKNLIECGCQETDCATYIFWGAKVRGPRYNHHGELEPRYLLAVQDRNTNNKMQIWLYRSELEQLQNQIINILETGTYPGLSKKGQNENNSD